MFLNFLNDFSDYESRKVSKDELKNGLTVSTAYTSDEGFETAIIDGAGTHPVERYATKELAEEGHAKWIEFAKAGIGKSITKLFWSDFGDGHNEQVILRAPETKSKKSLGR